VCISFNDPLPQIRTKLHHHTTRRSDDLPGQKYVLQSERLDLLTVLCFPCEVHLEQQKQSDESIRIVSQHPQLKDHFHPMGEDINFG
jgi:hypothetical protein